MSNIHFFTPWKPFKEPVSLIALTLVFTVVAGCLSYFTGDLVWLWVIPYIVFYSIAPRGSWFNYLGVLLGVFASIYLLVLGITWVSVLLALGNALLVVFSIPEFRERLKTYRYLKDFAKRLPEGVSMTSAYIMEIPRKTKNPVRKSHIEIEIYRKDAEGNPQLIRTESFLEDEPTIQ